MKLIVDSLLFLCIYAIGEAFANVLIFPFVMQRYLKRKIQQQPEDEMTSWQEPEENQTSQSVVSEPAPENDSPKNTAILMGLLERLALFLGLAMGVQQILTLFSALKLATHFLPDALKGTDHEKVSKEYFFIGNITSVLLALGYMLIWHWLSGLDLVGCVR